MTFSRAVVSARTDDGRKRGFVEVRGAEAESLLAKPAARSETGRAEAAEQVEKRAAREARGIERDKGRKDTILTSLSCVCKEMMLRRVFLTRPGDGFLILGCV